MPRFVMQMPKPTKEQEAAMALIRRHVRQKLIEESIAVMDAFMRPCACGAEHNTESVKLVSVVGEFLGMECKACNDQREWRGEPSHE